MVQLNVSLLELLDQRAAREGISRSQLIRDAVQAYLDADARAAALQLVIEGYAQRPEADEDIRRAHADARTLVEDEPW